MAGSWACGRGGGRVWGHVAGLGYVIGGQAYVMDGYMWQEWSIWQGVEACGRVWRPEGALMAGCGGIWQGLGYVVGDQAYGMNGEIWQEWEQQEGWV